MGDVETTGERDPYEKTPITPSRAAPSHQPDWIVCMAPSRGGARRRGESTARRRARYPRAHVAGPDHAVALFEQPLPLPEIGSPRILIVEDDVAAAGAIRAALELEGEPGWDIQVAGEGQRALELASAVPPEVVLLDVGLPDVDGAEVYRRLRANPLTARTRVLFLSGATSLDLHQRGIDGGVLLRKPFDLRALAGLVRTLLVA
jgi:CheY-like chemotaxis protein